MNSETAPAPWYANLLLVAGVVLTVVMALLMSQLDRLQTRLVPTVPVVAQVTEPVMTPTPLSAIALATAVPASPTSDVPATDSVTGSTAVPTVACGQPPAGWVAYAVQAGDTLFALSQKTGAAVDQIIQVNCLEAKQFVTGMQIYLPVAPPQQIVCGPPGWWVRYTVQAGDTLFSLARSRGTTIYQIMNANCMVGTRLYVGRQIYLPPGGATAVPTATPVPPPTKTPRPTNTAVRPTNTATPPPVPTLTPTITSTSTGTAVPATLTSTATATATGTVTSTATGTAVPPTNTATPPPTSTATQAPLPTNTATPTAVPPTNTATPTATLTPTPEPPTATPTETPGP